MKSANLFVAVLLFAGTVLAQQAHPDRPPGAGFPRTDALKSYLNLSDQQVADLTGVQKLFFDAAKPLFEQIFEKQKALREELGKEPVNSAVVEQLRTEIRNLMDQVQSKRSEFTAQARNILTPTQLAMLASLEQALSLQAAAREAVALNLIDTSEGFGGPFGGGLADRALPLTGTRRGGGLQAIPHP